MKPASRTISIQTEDIRKKWVLIDAANQPLGRLASKVASIVRGKTKPTFTPHLDTGDNVIIINAAQVKLTGNKLNDKIYYHHTGYPGGIKSRTAREILEKKPATLLQKAVVGMLPKNRLGRQLKNNFRIYDNDAHPHQGQNPEVITL
ncbi:MAG: 50S ribosomal protein L13 [Nitrospinae bacterium CG11_big_fil_rev_8_21_14_0_20_56_8]|nr:MAG: 50S ribosomal protein L13 [Nitrospinae bacterium CG11_big_fil_rev_8_21_14_0_20_56_8]